MKISVVMPVFNAESTVVDSVQSILKQTFREFEFIIINDGSTDQTCNYLDQINDDRVIIHSFKVNQGIVKSLNWGIDICRGDYVVRMDADDIALPDRLQTLVQHCQKMPQVDVFCSYVIKEASGSRFVHKCPVENDQIRANLLFTNPLIHPATMIKKSVFEVDRYRLEYQYIEDYALWIQLLRSKVFYCIPKELLIYRAQVNSICSTHHHLQSNRVYSLLDDLYTKIGISSANREYLKAMYLKDFSLYFTLGRAKDIYGDLDKISKYLLIDIKVLNQMHDENRELLRKKMRTLKFLIISVGKYLSRKNRIISSLISFVNRFSMGKIRYLAIRSSNDEV